MAAPARRLTLPTCVSCIRSLAWSDLGRPPQPLFAQLRGKKTKPNRHHMQYVKLVADIKGYGPQGAILAIPPGQMRNYWYPQGVAQYITGTDLTEIKRNPHLIAPRDPEFGKEKRREDEEVVKVDTQLLSPERSQELLQKLLPEYIQFFRPVISAQERSKPQFSEAEVVRRDHQPQAIFGSVSAQDIVQHINDFLALKGAEAANNEAGRIVLRPEDIKLIQSEITSGIEDDRIKFLGDFEFELQIKGAQPVRRKVRVNAQA